MLEASGADLTGSTGTYSWSPSNVDLTSSSGQITYAYSNTAANGSVIATGTTTGPYNSCSSGDKNTSQPFPLNIAGDFPSLSVSPSSPTIYSGCSVNLSAISTNGEYFSWSPGNGLNSISGNEVTASPTITTTYYVNTVDLNTSTANSEGCCSSGSIVVNVEQLSVTGPASICIGSTATLSISDVISGSTYSWSSTSSLSATGSSITDNPTTSTTYTVSTCSGDASVQFDLTVNPLPNITVSPSSARVCTCDTPTLTAYGGISYLWSPSAGLSSATGSNVTATPTVTTTYTVTGTDGKGCINTAISTVESICIGVLGDCCEDCDDDLLKKKIDTAFNTSQYLKIYPDPNNGNFTLNISTGDTSNSYASISIFNMMGSLLFKNSIALNNGLYQGSFSYPNLPSGMYFIEMDESGQTMHTKFNIVH